MQSLPAKPPDPALPASASQFVVRRQIITAFGTLALIWSFTPLCVVWGVREISPVWALIIRFILASAVLGVLALVLKTPVPLSRQALASYVAGAVSVFGSMLLCYLGAMYVPSSIIAVIFGLSPLVTGLFNHFTGSQAVSRTQWLYMLLAVSGLAMVILPGHMQIPDDRTGHGYLYIVMAMLLNVCSILLVKRINAGLTPMAQTTGSLLVALLPCLVLAGIYSSDMPHQLPSGRLVLSTLFLAVVSSAGAFMIFFRLIQLAPPSTVALVTVASPVLAMLWGHGLNHEPLTRLMLGGLVTVTGAVVLYLRQSNTVKAKL